MYRNKDNGLAGFMVLAKGRSRRHCPDFHGDPHTGMENKISTWSAGASLLSDQHGEIAEYRGQCEERAWSAVVERNTGFDQPGKL